MADKKKATSTATSSEEKEEKIQEEKVLTEEEMHDEFIRLMKSGEYATTVRNAKASVFTNLFEKAKYALKLFKVFHPEITDISIDDIDIVTLEVTLVNSPYNDLGILAKDKFIILVEAQSTWSVNILIRILIYLAYSYKNYITSHGLDVYDSKIIRLPKPEFYVVYTGSKKVPEEIRLSKEFFNGEDIDIDIRAKVITKSVKGDILDQYIEFAHEFDRNRVKFGNAEDAAQATYKHCIQNDILAEYFIEQGQKEAIGLMKLLFDEETMMRNHDISLIRNTERRMFVNVYQDLGHSLADTTRAFINKFKVGEETAREDIAEYWKK